MNIDRISTDGRAFSPIEAQIDLSNAEQRTSRFSFIMIVLNGMPFIEYSLKSVYDFAHEIIIVEGAVENCMFAANANGGSTDGTVEFIESFPDPQNKIKLIRGRWPEKCEMQNEALKHVTGNYVWLIDSDEVYKKEHLERIGDILRSDASITQVNFIPDCFWKGLDYIFVSGRFFEDEFHYRRVFKYVPGAKFVTHRPPTMVWPGHDRTTEQMNLLDGTATREMGIVLYHYSYVLDEQVKQKVELYHRYGWDRHWKLDLGKWYEECFLKWTPENRQEIDSAYPIWTGDINSRTQIFNGTHPEVMKDFGKEPGRKEYWPEGHSLSVIGKTDYQKKVLDAWRYIKIDAPLQNRRRVMTENMEQGRSFWNIHVALAFLADRLRPQNYLEVGVRTGGSLIPLVHNCDVKEIVGVDMWPASYSGLYNSMEYTAGQISRYKTATGKRFEIELIKGDSHSVLKDLIASGRRFSLITVDGDHSEPGAWEDLQDAVELLGDEGAIVFDDIIHPAHLFLNGLVDRLVEKYPFFQVLINSEQDNGCAVFLKKIDPAELLQERGVEASHSKTDCNEHAVGGELPIATDISCGAKVKNILWIRTDSIGDAVLSSSMLPHIRRKWEDARITVVCQEHVAELYEACPDVDEIVAFNKKQALQNDYYREDIIRKLRALKPDLSLNSVYSREALTDWFALKCGAKQCVAHEGNLCNIPRDIRNANNRLYTELLASGGEHKTELERHKDFLKGLGIEATGLQPMIWTRPSDEEFAERIFRDTRLAPARTIALFAGAQYDCRVYERYGEALAEFCRANRLDIVALGTGREEAINQRNSDAAGVRAVNLSGKTSILESAAVLKRCRLAVGAETGLAHICCAVGTPNIILLGGGHFGRFMPYSPLTSVACLPLDCFGCNWDCRYDRAYCVKDVAPEVISEALRQSLEESSHKIRVFVQGSSLWRVQGGRPEWKGLEQSQEADNIEVIAIEGCGNVSPVEESATRTAKPTAECDVSIVLCTKDRGELLDRMLSSLEKAACGVVYELIVVEGGSSDNTLDVLRRHNVWRVHDESQCLGPGRHSWPKLYNFGFSKARGKWAMYASDDIVFSPNSIARAVEMLDKQKEEVAGGVFFYKNLHPTRQEWAEYGIDFTGGNKLLLNYGLVRLDHFRECGGLEECYNFYCADTDLCYKLYEGGRQLIPLSGCFVTHDNLLDVQKRANAGRSVRDIELCRRRWRHFVSAEDPKPTRLLWREDFVEAFDVPHELKRIDSSIESFWRGLACFGQGMFAEAEEQFMQAVQSQCDHRQVLWHLALAADKCGDYAIAEKAATGVVRQAPDFEPALELLLRVTKTEQYLTEPVGKTRERRHKTQDPRHQTQDTRRKTRDSRYNIFESGVWSLESGDAGEPEEQASPVATAVKMARPSGPDHSEMELRREIGRFNKVVVWGLKTSEHTHAHIHRHFFETLEKVGARAVFVDDTTDSANVIGRNDLVIAVDVAISHLTVRNDAYYCLHNCPEEIHRRIAPGRNIRLATYMNCAEQAGEKWDEVTFFDSATRTLFQPWATDLLAREFREPVLDRSGRIVFWVGSIWDDAVGRGNVNEIQMLRDILEVRGVRFVHLRGISDSLNIRYVRNSLIAPAIVGRWQMQNNYLPCRMWKNISYGQLGVSNVRKFDDIFDDCAVKGGSIEELIDNALSLPSGTYRDMIYRQQEIVKERHTYVNRLLNIIKAFESIQNC